MMSVHQPILPGKAIELLKSRNLSIPEKLLADYAAAGLIKTYALVREIRAAGGPAKTVRDSQVPQEEWARIVASDEIMTALNGGTVRLLGSNMPGGMPAVEITGIRFSEDSLTKILNRYCAMPDGDAQGALRKQVAPAKNATALKVAVQSKAERVVPPIKPGDLTASVAQTMQVTGLGRTKVDQLMRNGDLVRKKVGKRTLITVESIERLVGASVSSP